MVLFIIDCTYLNIGVLFNKYSYIEKGECMNNFKKVFMTTAVTALTAAVFFVNSKVANAAASQSPKTAASTTKTVKKRIITPSQARNFLNDLDMPTRDYTDSWGPNSYGKYEADSDSFILESRNPNQYKNNLTYSVFGDKYVAKAVELSLNVNDMSFSSNAIDELIKYSNALMYKVTGKNLTPEIKKAMKTKTSGEWIVNGYKTKLKAETFPDEELMQGIEPTSDHGAFGLEFIIEL